MKTSKLLLSDGNLILGIKKRREEEVSKLQIVKWVWDHSDMKLRESKSFVDNN